MWSAFYRRWALVIIFSTGFLVNLSAQEYTNELAIGVTGAYYFDSNPFRVHEFRYDPIPIYFEYSHYFKDKNFGLLISYDNSVYDYLDYSVKWDISLVPNQVIFRRNNIFTFSGFRVRDLGERISFRYEGGVSYRSGSLERYHIRFVYQGAKIIDRLTRSRHYGNLGLNIKGRATYYFLPKIGVNVGIGFTKYFNSYSNNIVECVIGLGYRF